MIRLAAHVRGLGAIPAMLHIIGLYLLIKGIVMDIDGCLAVREELLGVLACPFCRSVLSRERGRFCGDVYFLACQGCGSVFPVLLGRPLLVPKGREGVKWPRAEAVGWRAQSAMEAVAHLGELQGQGKDIASLVTWMSEPWEPYTRSEWLGLVERTKSQAQARGEGKWWEANDRRERLLHSTSGSIPNRQEERSTLDEFAHRAIRNRPKRILDLATGAGGGISRILNQIEGIELAVATERDLRCTWQIQYKIEHFRPGLFFEAVGCDVRRLPLRDESFDYATCYHALGELCGVSRVLEEAWRVLQPSGILQLSFTDTQLADYAPPEAVPDIVDWLRENRVIRPQAVGCFAENLTKLGREEFRAFLEKADLFINLNHLEQKAEESGFTITDRYKHPRLQRPDRPRSLASHDFILSLKKEV